MKKVKKLISVLVCMAMLCAVLPCVTVGAEEIVDSGEMSLGLTWTLGSDGTLTISGQGISGQGSWLASDTAYIYNSLINPLITAVVVEGSVSIGNYAFESCSSLTSINIPDSITSIGEETFRDCAALTDVYYTGTEEQWDVIAINLGNDDLNNATIHYNYIIPVMEIISVSVAVEDNAVSVTVETENVMPNNNIIAVGFGDGGAGSVSLVENNEATLPAEGVTTVKVFCWESLESMIPLCEAKEVTVQ